MSLWTEKVFFKTMMIERKYGCILFRVFVTPLRLFAVFSTSFFIVSVLIYLELFSDENRSAVDFIKYDKSPPLFRYGPTKNNPTFEKTNNCSIYKFKSTLEVAGNDTDVVTCKRTPPLTGSCDVAKEIFLSHDHVNCSFQERNEFCQMQRSKSRGWIVSCNADVAKVCTSSLTLGLPSPDTGEFLWEKCKNVSVLEEKLMIIVNSLHYGFAFIHCDKRYTDYEDDNMYYHPPDESYAEQLLILPPVTKKLKPKLHSSNNFHDLNINLVLVDSVSHQHFFRSLPESASVLEKIASRSVSNIFNFELFQAVKSRTFETLQVIFSGSVNISEPPFGVHDIPKKPLNLKPIFQTFRDRGYKTLWLEDLCYLWEWGLSKDLHFLELESLPEETWKRMWLTLEKNGVDSIDATISMCRLLERNGVKDHFHGPQAVCFNGKHQHEYLLDYLKLYQEEMNARKQPFLTMTSTNVGHEGTGVRVQTLDQALAEYLKFTSSLENTISIIFSDHGNAYGKYFHSSKEAYVELYHPFMFFIIPHSAASLLGKEMMNSISTNTKRLITALDLHYMLHHIADINSKGGSQAVGQEFPVSEKGLLDPVDPLRTCNSVPRIRPNMCICQNFNLQLEISSYASLFGYLAVGIINNEIQRQFHKTIDDKLQMGAFGRCHPLYLKNVTDIKESAGLNGQRLFQMNIHVQMSQVFYVSIGMTTDKQGQPSVVLDTVSRITPYGIFSECSDTSIDLTLCICNLSESEIKDSQPDEIYRSFQYTTTTFQESKMNALPLVDYVKTPLGSNPCLHIVYYKHRDGAAVFSINTCKSIYSLNIKIDAQRKFIYYHKKGKFVLLPGGVEFLALVVSENGEPWTLSLQADIDLIQYL